MLVEPPAYNEPRWCLVLPHSIRIEIGLGVDNGGLVFEGTAVGANRIEGYWHQEFFESGDHGKAVLTREQAPK